MSTSGMYNPQEVFGEVEEVRISSNVAEMTQSLTDLQPKDGKVKLSFQSDCETSHLQQYAAHLSSLAGQRTLEHLW